jgi:hypothetical protein
VRYTLGARYLYIKRNVEKVWGARYLPENTVLCFQLNHGDVINRPILDNL